MEYSTINILTARSLGFLAGLGLAASAAGAQTYGFDWAAVGDPGNRDTLPDEVPAWPDLETGGVDYEYRIMRTEVTVEQHFEFVQAYWQYAPPEVRRSSSFKGRWIGTRGGNDDPQYYLVPGTENLPTEMSWRYGARFVNWLHNGKASEQWAFEDGAYDTSTFGMSEDWTLTDQAERSPGAKFWIPSMDEYVKGMFWDPEKNGTEGGYWAYPHSKDVPPIPGMPWNGGETNAGIDWDEPYLDVGSYPWATSPWGLLDGSGGVREWIETLSPDGGSRLGHGSFQYDGLYDIWDRIDEWDASNPDFPKGLRLASVVPSPGTTVVLVIALSYASRRRRQK